MKNNLSRAVICCLVIVLLLFGAFPAGAVEKKSVGEAQSLIDGIVAYKLKEAGVSSVQQWIDGSLSKCAGTTSEWYIIALSQNGDYDFSNYESALLRYLSEEQVYSASSRQKYALALIASGSTDSYIYKTLNDSIGQQGVMSWIFGLHLLNNGYTSGSYSLADIKKKLLSLQLSDGGWAVMGTNSEVDVTAMASQALAPYYQSDSSVREAVDKALRLLSDRQLSAGDYASYGVSNPESTAQVLLALSSLGIDCKTDGRFIKNGNTLFDAIAGYRLSDGTFCHRQGTGYNETATVQVFCAMVSYLRMSSDKTGFYMIDARNPSGLKIPADTTTATEPTEAPTCANKPTEKGTEDESLPPVSENNDNLQQPTVPASVWESDPGKDNTDTTETDTVASDDVISDNVPKNSETSAAGEEEPSEDSTPDADRRADPKQKDGGYKLWVSLSIMIIAGGICVVLYLLKKRNVRNFIMILSATGVAVVVVLITNFQTTDDYYKNAEAAKDSVIGTVTISIRCDTIADKSDDAHIPDDGVILDVTEFEIEAGDTVYDILSEAAGKYQIHLETNGNSESAYVEGIGNIYELDFGELSGWIYFVNGTSPSVGCGAYELSDHDKIEWHYTCDLGKDLV